MLIAENGRERVAVFKTGFNDFARESLSNFDRLGDSATLGNESWKVGAGT